MKSIISTSVICLRSQQNVATFFFIKYQTYLLLDKSYCVLDSGTIEKVCNGGTTHEEVDELEPRFSKVVSSKQTFLDALQMEATVKQANNALDPGWN